MEKEFDILKQTLLTNCKNGKIYYMPNSGNWGDALIRYGTIAFFKKHNISFTEIFSSNDLPEQEEKQYLIYGGGGGWCKLWNHSSHIINRLAPHFEKVIILPSSYELYHNLPNCIYFRRDDFESKQLMPHAIFCHDMAFVINYKNSIDVNGTGYFFRTDAESSKKIQLPKQNLDISLKSNHYGDVPLFFDIISKYKEIHTDRLHVAIAGALLKRKVYLHEGSYFKISAVFKSSMLNYFDTVELV